MLTYPGTIPVADVHRWKTEATQQLLGHTIALTEEAWHQPTGLPGWTRAHVATHLARNAEFFDSIVQAAQIGAPLPTLAAASVRRSVLEVGAERHALELQIDLDGTAGALQNTIDAITDWTPAVELDGAQLTLAAVPLARLHEVNVHHLDLNCGLTIDDIPADAAEWLLRWALFRLRNTNLPTIRVISETMQTEIGHSATTLEVSGTDANLWAWLSGRADAEVVTGANEVRLPLLS
jgi:maleylpyruvate isomerase